MPNISLRSKKGIKHILHTNNVYSITKFPIPAALQDSGIPLEEDIQFLRDQWLWDNTGFYRSVDQYATIERRVSELQYYGDFLNTLRQRINITHELIDCNFDSNLPVHISVEPRTTKAKTELDLTDLESCKKFRFIIHPGQTRVQGALFLEEELKNVILYIKKEYEDIVDIKKDKFIDKILGERKLISCYRPSTYYNEEIALPNLEYDFFLPNQPTKELGLKAHKSLRGEETPILKCNKIIEKGTKNNYHSSDWYILKSFVKSNKFFGTLFNNFLNVYTTNTKQAEKIQLRCSKLPGNMLERGNYRNGNNSLGARTKLYNYVMNTEFGKKEKTFISDYTDLINRFDSPINYTPTKVYKQITKLDIDNIVKKNEYKGFAIVHLTEKSKWKRDYFELLFAAPPSVGLVRDKKSSILLINCEAKHWRDKTQELKEYILTDTFVS